MARSRRRVSSVFVVSALLATNLAILSSAPGWAESGVTWLASAADGSTAHPAGSSEVAALSADGGYVAFVSAAPLVDADTNGAKDVYRRDVHRNITELVSVALDGGAGDADSAPGGTYNIAISGDGSKVAFVSNATNLVEGDTNGVGDLFVRDLGATTTTRVSVTATGAQVGESPVATTANVPALSRDGRWLAFYSLYGLVTGQGGGTYVRDLQGGTDNVVHVSKATDGTSANSAGLAGGTAISADGRFVVFNSTATNLAPGDTNAEIDVFVHDRDADADAVLDEPGGYATELVSVATAGGAGAGRSLSGVRAISDDGSQVVFHSTAADLVVGDGNGQNDVFLRDRTRGVTTRVSLDRAGQELTGSSFGASISGDGAWIAFASSGSLVEGVGGTHAYATRPSAPEAAELLDVSSSGVVANNSTSQVEISHDGTAAAFRSFATNLTDGTPDGNGAADVFVRLRDLTSISATLTAADADGGDAVVAVPAGIRDVDVAAIPMDRLLGILGGPEAAPLSKMPLSKMPLSKMPLSKMPLSKMPLSKMPLSKMPVDGGWPPILAGTPLEHVPVAALTLQDVYDLDGGATLGALEIGQVALGQALPNVGLASIALGSTPLSKMPVDDVANGGWCGFLASVGYPCPQDGAGYLASTALIELDLQGVPLSKMPLHQVPLSKMDIAASPIAEIPLSKMAVGSTPLSKMPLSRIVVTGSPLAPITLHTISTDLAVLDTIVDCGAVACDSGQTTIGDAAAVGAIRPGAVLGDLVAGFGALTVGDLLPFFTNDVVFGVLILSLLDLADYPWEALDLEALGVRSGPPATYQLQILVGGSGTGSDGQASVTLPAGFRYVPDSATFASRSCSAMTDCVTSSVGLTPSREEGSTVTFDVGRLLVGTSYTLTLQAHPGLTLGTFTASAEVRSGEQVVAVAPTAPVTVTENWEDAEHGGPNDAPANAPIAQAGRVHVGHIAEPGDLDYVRIAAPPAGTRISVRMSNLASDNDLVMFRPVDETPPSATPQRTVPLDNAPIRDTGVTGPQGAQVLDDVPMPDVGAGPAAVSANRADTAEEVDALATTSSATPEYFTVQVSGYNGAVSDDWYQMYVKYVPVFDPPSCSRTLPHDQGAAPTAPVRWYDAATGTHVDGTVLPADTETVFVVNQQRLRGTYGAAGHQTVMDGLDGFLAQAGTLTDNPVKAAIVSVDAFEAVRAAATDWDAHACVPDKANVHASAVNAAVRGLRTVAAEFDHLVLVGGDDVIPMGRAVDDTTIANEDTYADVFTSASPLQAALLSRHVLTDDSYADLDPITWMDRSLYVADLAVGRLVESPADIAGQLQQFVGSGGQLDPQTALTTGYDFLADGATLIDQNLGARIPASNRTTLIDETWTRQAVVDALLPASGDSPDVASVNAHYDHYRALPALGNATADESDLFTVDDVPATSTPLVGRILFSMGCHGGLSVPDAYVGAGGLAADWAQTFGAQRAIWVANTGYGYGDDAALALSEQLMADFAAYLDGSVTAGEALVFAKQAYFGRLGAYGAYDEKVLEQPVLYGLPMYRIGTSSTATATTASSTDTTAATSLAGVSTAPQDFTFQGDGALQRATTDRGSYYHVGGETQVTHFRPIQPRTSAEVTMAGTQARGALITGLTSRDEGINPVFATPTVDMAATAPEAVADVDVFPTHLLNLSTYEAPEGTRQRLVVMPGQYFADGDGRTDTGIQRVYDAVQTVVYYNDDPAAEHVEPEFLSADATIAAAAAGNEATFEVRTVDRTTAGEPTPTGTVHRVLVMFKDAGGWHDLELVRDTVDATTWRATTAVAGDRVEFLAQSVDLAGNVGVTTNKGRLFDTVLLPAGQTEPGPAPQLLFSGSQGQGGWYHGDVAVAVSGSDGVTYTTTVDGAEGTTASGEGVHLVETRGSDGSINRATVGIDTAAPTVHLTVPSVVQVGEPARAVATCNDTGAGIAACDLDPTILDTSSVGTHQVHASARDHSGRSVQTSATYEVVADQAPAMGELTLSHNPIAAGTGTSTASITIPAGSPAPDGIELQVDGQAPQPMVAVGGGRYELAVGPLDVGVYGVQAVASFGDHQLVSDELFLAVYDPDAGFVTGGGWIDSRAGAYAADPDVVGRANFGFVSKYAKGATKPSGKTQFQFQVANFTFFSDDYDWLVVSGERAQYKGKGTVNEVPGYGFLLTALDADASPDPTDTDGFRIKIWELASGDVVYDNRMGTSDDMTESQAIGGGSIVIHTKKK